MMKFYKYNKKNIDDHLSFETYQIITYVFIYLQTGELQRRPVNHSLSTVWIGGTTSQSN